MATTVAVAPKAEAYASFEHAFANVGTNYTQANGDNYCRSKYESLKGVSYIPNYGWDPEGYNRSVRALDGYRIVDPNWIWYHKNNGQCIANK